MPLELSKVCCSAPFIGLAPLLQIYDVSFSELLVWGTGPANRCKAACRQKHDTPNLSIIHFEVPGPNIWAQHHCQYVKIMTWVGRVTPVRPILPPWYDVLHPWLVRPRYFKCMMYHVLLIVCVGPRYGKQMQGAGSPEARQAEP